MSRGESNLGIGNTSEGASWHGDVKPVPGKLLSVITSFPHAVDGVRVICYVETRDGCTQLPYPWRFFKDMENARDVAGEKRWEELEVQYQNMTLSRYKELAVSDSPH